MVDRMDPYQGYNFSVELDGITRAGFRECSGLQSTQNVVTYREGTDVHLSPRKMPGLSSQSDVTLGRGITKDRALWDWHEKTSKGTVERHDVSVSLLDNQGHAKITWNLFGCWPTTWSGPSLHASSDEVAVETLTLTCERIEVDQWT